jgi:hypothetical protein
MMMEVDQYGELQTVTTAVGGIVVSIMFETTCFIQYFLLFV